MLFLYLFHGLLSPWRMEGKLNEMLRKQEKTMALVDDIKTGMSQAHDEEGKLIAALTAALASNKSLSDQLAAALAANDTTALQAIKDQLDADNSAMQAAIDAASAPTTSSGAGGTTSAGP